VATAKDIWRLERLCLLALRRLEEQKHDIKTFIEIGIEAAGGKLLDNSRFREWMVGYMSQNSNALRESALLRSIALEGGHRAWMICSVLMCSLDRSEPEVSRYAIGYRTHT